MTSKAELERKLHHLNIKCSDQHRDHAILETHLNNYIKVMNQELRELRRQIRDFVDVLGYKWVEKEAHWERKEDSDAK